MAQLLTLILVLFAGTACQARLNRIVGGELTTIEEYTSIAQVEFLGIISGAWSQSCACNILNSLNVLSAAHCFAGSQYSPTHRRVRAGATFRNTGGIVSNVAQEHNHPSYGALGFDGDITVVRLAEPLVFSPVVQQGVIVAQDAVIPDDQPVIHAGWGATAQGGSVSNQLRDVTIFTINNDLCRERYQSLPTPALVTPNMICAGILDVGGRDACQGDSGGPLYYGNIIIGVVSWGHGCANGTFPGVSTAVSPYTNWIIDAAS
ncbi:trypsin, alkaline C-like [Achroia grisella]|uniref:trypsin, alkaline C-like n=1 Tax=Achroia grisella TaxID=688607 RepID=UPI0027D31D46|nr:trypsin, alkaline C-like [Achroia grisella]